MVNALLENVPFNDCNITNKKLSLNKLHYVACEINEFTLIILYL